jgi:hypothetical protein
MGMEGYQPAKLINLPERCPRVTGIVAGYRLRRQPRLFSRKSVLI